MKKCKCGKPIAHYAARFGCCVQCKLKAIRKHRGVITRWSAKVVDESRSRANKAGWETRCKRKHATV